MVEAMDRNSIFVADRLASLRDKHVSSWRKRHVFDELGRYVLAQVCEELAFANRKVVTPLSTVDCQVIDDEVITVPVLRSGLSLSSAALDIWPDSYVWDFGAERIESESGERPKINVYMDRTMDVRDWGFDPVAVILDPMLASGGSAEVVCDVVKNRGVKRIIFVSIFAATLGVKRLADAHPDVRLYACSISDKLTPNFFIEDGMGDAGDDARPRCPAHLRRERPKMLG